MSAKFEKLLQRIEEVQKFATARVNRFPTFGEVARELDKLAETLRVGKLRVQIVSQSPVLARALQTFVSTRTNLAAMYQFKTAPFPTQSQRTEIASSAAFILKYVSISGQQHTRYPLPIARKVLIGRQPDCQIRIPNEYTLVSGHHAEVLPLLNPSSGKADWQFCDTSTNGTYINGQKLHHGCQILQAGDRIVLGYKEPTEKSPELIFECESNSASTKNDEFEGLLGDCDVLCLVVNPTQPFSAGEKQMIEKGIKAQVLKSAIILDNSAPSPDSQTNVAAIEVWIKSQNSSQSLILASVPLGAFYSNSQGHAVSPTVQREAEPFVQFLENLANSGFEEVLKERVKQQFLAQINLIDASLRKEETALTEEIKKLEDLLQGLSDQELNKALQQVNADKDKTFQQVKSQLLESKDALLHPFSKNSLLYRIKDLTDELQPVVTRKEAEVYLTLRSDKMGDRENLNNYIKSQCYREIINWVNEEWKKICFSYGNGGFNGLFQRTEATLLKFTSMQKSNSPFYSEQPNFDVYKYLQDSLVACPSEISYQENGSPIGGWIGIAVSTIIAALRLQGGDFTSPLMALNSIINILMGGNARQRQAAAQLEHQTENLKRGFCNHYQGLAKYLVEKMVQNCFLLFTFEAESRRLKEMIESFNNERITSIHNLKKRIEERKAIQNHVKNDRPELLKRVKGE